MGASLVAKAAEYSISESSDTPLSRAGSLPEEVDERRIKKAHHPMGGAPFCVAASVSCPRRSSARSTPNRCEYYCAIPGHYRRQRSA
ncbi:hypothetical protein FJD35_27065 [Pseudomonas mandelii]|nr:hypothetical protein FJD35_27065 [Pseudomonas mandelii]